MSYLLAQDTINGAEGKITITRSGRILEICGMKNIKTIAGMNEFTRSLLYVALLVCVPIVTACIQKGIASCR